MDTVQNRRWGPALWRLLHSSAERIGTKILHRLPHEESRLWSQFLQSLRFSLPCPHCRGHYQAFLEANPLPLASFRREDIRVWLYRLHIAVQERLGTAEGRLSLSEVEEQFSAPFCFSEALRIFAHDLRLAVQRGICRREDRVTTLRHAEELRRFYDFF